MKSGRTATVLAWFLGGTFIVMGIAEVAVRVLSDEPIETEAVVFWFLSLCGGGMLVLIGSFMLTRPTWASVTLVTLGCLAGTLATMWTLVLPVLALTLVVLTAWRAGESATSVPD